MLYIVLILTIIIFMLLLDLFVARTYRHEKVPHYSTPAKYNISYNEIDRYSCRKTKHLNGWRLPGSQKAPTIILVHGWGRNRSRMLLYNGYFYPLGYNLLAFYARNHGSSSLEKHPTVWTFFRGHACRHKLCLPIRLFFLSSALSVYRLAAVQLLML